MPSHGSTPNGGYTPPPSPGSPGGYMVPGGTHGANGAR